MKAFCWRRLAVFSLSLLAPSASSLHANEASIDFSRDIRPILSEHCYACHGPGDQEAGLRLDSAAAAEALLMYQQPEARRSTGVRWCNPMVMVSSSNHHRMTCPCSTFITAESRCHSFATLDHAAALKAMRKRFALMAEFCQEGGFLASFFRLLQAHAATRSPA